MTATAHRNTKTTNAGGYKFPVDPAGPKAYIFRIEPGTRAHATTPDGNDYDVSVVAVHPWGCLVEIDESEDDAPVVVRAWGSTWDLLRFHITTDTVTPAE